jgi:hypothetical protein
VYLSKTLIRSSACEHFFARYYLDAHAQSGVEIHSSLRRTGTEAHRYKSEYINHLVKHNKSSDAAWVAKWVKAQDLSEETREIIARDVREFSVDPDTIYETELYLGMDGNFQPTEQLVGGIPGQQRTKDATLFGGTVDLFGFWSSKRAFIVDWKSGYAMLGLSEVESAMYAALAFSHFPKLESVEFTWDFLRLNKQRVLVYERKELEEWIWPLLLNARTRILEIVQRYEKQGGKQMAVNPTAGLCGYCALQCPLSTAFRGEIASAPIQTSEDASKSAQAVFVARQWIKREEAALQAFIKDRGPTDMGGGFVAELKVLDVKSYPLVKGLGEITKEDDIPMDKLTIGGLSGYLKAKKREYLRERMAAIAKVKHRTVLSICKKNDPEQALIEEPEEE